MRLLPLLPALASVSLLAVACGSRTGLTIESTQPDASTVDGAANPIDVTCPSTTGVQPGAPWPTPRRCPTNAASSPTPGFGARAPHVQWTVPLVASLVTEGANLLYAES